MNISSILKILRDSLVDREQALRQEQAVYGLDSLSELQLHELFEAALRPHYAVAREVHYPASAGNKLSHRQRCDLVLTPSGRPLRLDRSPLTLFDPPNPATADEAFWLEVKVAYQFREGNVRHSGYGTQWRSLIIADLRKTATEPAIGPAGLLLAVFTESLEVVQSDLRLFSEMLVRKEIICSEPSFEHVAVADRMGHGLLTLAFWPVVKLANTPAGDVEAVL